MDKKKILMGFIAFVAIGFIISIFYRLFFEFKNADVKAYIVQEASAYTGSEADAAKIINDGVMNILQSATKTKQLRDYCSTTNLSKEQCLVHTAVMECRALGYLGAPITAS